MATLVPTTDLSLPIDRQDLFNMWADAALGEIARDDLAPGVFTFDRATHISAATTTPNPGHALYAVFDRLLFIFHDEVDDTGVSLWLAVGPDRFDVACLAAEPIPAGAVVEPWFDKWVRVASDVSGPLNLIAMGANQQGIGIVSGSGNPLGPGATAASGTWIPVAIDGYIWTYVVDKSLSQERWVRVSVGAPGSIEENVAGGEFQPLVDDPVGFAFNNVTAGTTEMYERILWTGPRRYRSLSTF